MKVSPKWKGTDDMVMVKVRDLVIDDTLYPREACDPEHVQRMIDAAAAGVAFPPIIAEGRTKRIVDGRHRREMAFRTMGPDGEVAVIFKRYKSDEEFFLDAIRYNAEHGLTLNPRDRVRSLRIAESLKISVTDTAGALRMSVHAAAKLTTAAVVNPAMREPALVTVSPRFAPRPSASRRDAVIRESRPVEAAAPQRPSIVSALDEVIAWLEAGGSIDDHPAVAERVQKLRGLIGEAVAA